MDVQAVHKLHAMVFDGLWADLQERGDLLGVLAFGNQLENFALPDRQLFERVFPVGDRMQRKPFQEWRGESLTRVNFIVNHPLQGGFDLLGSRFGLLSSNFGLFRARFRQFCPGFGPLSACLRQFCPAPGLLGPRFR